VQRTQWHAVAEALGSALRVDDSSAALLTVERWTEPAALPPRARDAWVYTRSLVIAHAKTYGVALDVDRVADERPDALALSAREAQHTRGSPLAMWMDHVGLGVTRESRLRIQRRQGAGAAATQRPHRVVNPLVRSFMRTTPNTGLLATRRIARRDV
jgi:hypothetical protein